MNRLAKAARVMAVLVLVNLLFLAVWLYEAIESVMFKVNDEQ